VKIFDRVLDGHDMRRAGGVDLVDQGGERRALAAASRSRDEHEPAFLGRDLFQHLWQQQIVNGCHAHRDDTENHPDRAALLESVAPEAAEARHAVCEVDLVVVSKLVAVTGGKDRRCHGDDVFVLETAILGCGNQSPADPHHRVRPDLDMKVRGAALNGNLQQIVDVHATGWPNRAGRGAPTRSGLLPQLIGSSRPRK
jgi:hypothetical protein